MPFESGPVLADNSDRNILKFSGFAKAIAERL